MAEGITLHVVSCPRLHAVSFCGRGAGESSDHLPGHALPPAGRRLREISLNTSRLLRHRRWRIHAQASRGTDSRCITPSRVFQGPRKKAQLSSVRKPWLARRYRRLRWLEYYSLFDDLDLSRRIHGRRKRKRLRKAWFEVI